MINTESLSKTYRRDVSENPALNNISLAIGQGDFVAVTGPSGCGKTTLLNILGFLDRADSGSFRFLGKEITGLTERQRSALRRKYVGFIFQNFNLITELTVFDNIALPLVYSGVPVRTRMGRVEEIMTKLDLSHRASYKPQQLSGGQQQRVAVARALIKRPELILADEPTGNLDSKSGNDVMNLLAQLHREGSTIVMVTHSEYDAGFASRIIRMRDGEIFSETESRRQADYFRISNKEDR